MPSPIPAPTVDADPSRRGLVNVLAQSFSGVKTFLDAVRLAPVPTSGLPAGAPMLEGGLVYDDTTKKVRVYNGAIWSPLVTGDHLSGLAAHSAANITSSDTNGLDATTVQGQLDELTTSCLLSGSSWTNINANVNTGDGWEIIQAVEVILIKDKVLLRGRVRRPTADSANSAFLALPNAYRVASFQPKSVVCVTGGPTAYIPLIVGGGYTVTPIFSILNEAAVPSYTSLDVILNGLELYFHL